VSKKKNIVLIGFMASGKSTVGLELARATGRSLVDTDEMIESRASATIGDIIAERGESSFRELEREAVADAASREEVVIAAGGGAVLDNTNVLKLRESGIVYFLEVEASEVTKRADPAQDRPLLPDSPEGIRQLMSKRRVHYREASDAAIATTGKQPHEIAGEILTDFNARAGEDFGD